MKDEMKNSADRNAAILREAIASVKQSSADAREVLSRDIARVEKGSAVIASLNSKIADVEVKVVKDIEIKLNVFEAKISANSQALESEIATINR